MLPWPRALALPAAVAVGAAHGRPRARLATDRAARCSGPNPLLGRALLRRSATSSRSRWRSIGAARDSAPRWRPRRRARRVWGFAVGGGVLAFMLSLGAARRRRGRGADAGRRRGRGGARRRRATVRGGARIAIVLVAPAPALAALAAARPRDRRRRPLHALGAAGRRPGRARARSRSGAFELSYSSLGRGMIAAAGGDRPRGARGGLPLARAAAGRARGAAGVRAAALRRAGGGRRGALTNDSGPIILLIGTSYWRSPQGIAAARRSRAARTPMPAGASASAADCPLIASPRCGSPSSRPIPGLFRAA